MTATLLWKRAPLWRFSLMSAVLCSFLFVLYPPALRQRTESPTAKITEEASYTPQPKTEVRAVANNVSTGQHETGIEPTLLGPLYKDSIQVGNFKLSLPEGNWAILAKNSAVLSKAVGTQYFLGRIEQKRLTGAITVTAINVKSASDELTKEALPRYRCDLPFATYTIREAAEEESSHFSCWYMHNFFTPNWDKWSDKSAKMNDLDRAGAQNMAALSITYPQDMATFTFFRREKWGSLWALYMFSPEKEGIISNKASVFRDSDWSPQNITRFPEKAAFEQKLKDWATSFWPLFKTAFDEGKTFP